MSGIYIKEKITSEKIPAQVPVESSTIESASRRRTWGTWNRKNLMRARFVCRSVRSVPWAVKKAYTQSGIKYDKGRMVMAILKSSFMPEEQKRGISRGYCRNIRPSRMY